MSPDGPDSIRVNMTTLIFIRFLSHLSRGCVIKIQCFSTVAHSPSLRCQCISRLCPFPYAALCPFARSRPPSHPHWAYVYSSQRSTYAFTRSLGCPLTFSPPSTPSRFFHLLYLCYLSFQFSLSAFVSCGILFVLRFSGPYLLLPIFLFILPRNYYPSSSFFVPTPSRSFLFFFFYPSMRHARQQ